MSICIPNALCRGIAGGLLLTLACGVLRAESDCTLAGSVIDPAGRAVPNAEVVLRNSATLVERAAKTDNEGRYEVSALPVGSYRLRISAPGFKLYTVESITMEVARTFVLDLHLEIGNVSEEVTVRSQSALIDSGTISVGHVIDERTVQDLPLNGRYFLDLAVLSPGSVTASQTGFGSAPTRGLGAFGLNTAGNR